LISKWLPEATIVSILVALDAAAAYVVSCAACGAALGAAAALFFLTKANFFFGMAASFYSVNVSWNWRI